jgi:hypothetical protein
MRIKGVEVFAIQVKQRKVTNNEEFRLSAISVTIDNTGLNNIDLTINNGQTKREVKAGEQFLLEAVTDCYYFNQMFKIDFTGAGAKEVLVWYNDFVNESNC